MYWTELPPLYSISSATSKGLSFDDACLLMPSFMWVQKYKVDNQISDYKVSNIYFAKHN